MPLLAALPDLERRDEIVVGGKDAHGAQWIGTCGHYCATSLRPFLVIPATGHLAASRFHEFFRIDGAQVTEVQALWDLPELMMPAGVWPMAPGPGAVTRAFGPTTQDGLADHAAGTSAVDLVIDMMTHLTRHPWQGGPEVMEMSRFWHPRFNWYGPAGIGTARGISGFRRWYQMAFLTAFPDSVLYGTGTSHHFLGAGDYASVTGWPNMRMTLTGGNWLDLPATGGSITVRCLDYGGWKPG